MRNKQESAVLKWMLKHYVYLGILAFAVAFALVPMHGMMRAGTVRDMVNSWSYEPMEQSLINSWAKDVTRNFLFYPVNLEMTCGLLGLIGFGGAMALFGHGFSRKQSMMYAGLPMKRVTDFRIRTETFLILGQLPVLICTGSYPLLIRGMGMEAYLDTGLYLRTALVMNMTVLYGFALGALSAQLFGTLWGALAGGAAIGCGAEIIYVSWYSITTWYLGTMERGKPVHLMTAWSPLASLYKGIYRAESFRWLPGAAGILILLGLAVWACGKNRPERAGNTLNLQGIRKPGRAWVTLIGGSAGALIVGMMMGTERSVYLGLVLGAVLLALGARMLAEQNLRVDRKGWTIPAVCLGCMLLCCLGLRADLFGYETYQPGLENIRSIGYGSVYAREMGEPEVIRFEMPENVEAASRWAETFLAQAREKRAKRPFRIYDESDMRFQWETADGKTVVRQYPALTEENQAKVREEIRTLADSGEFRARIAEQIPDYSHCSGGGYLSFSLRLEEDEFREVFGFNPRINWDRIRSADMKAAMEADLAERTWEDMQGLRVNQFYFYENDEETGNYLFSGNYTIYPGDSHMIGVLYGSQAERVREYMAGGWADSEDVLVFRCEYVRDENQGEYMTGYTLAATPEEKRAWVAETTECSMSALMAPVTETAQIRIYTRPAVIRWMEENGDEERMEDPAFWSSLPDWDDIYEFVNLPIRADK